MFETETKRCRHGTFTYYVEDEFVGRSLATYGEFSEQEVAAIAKILRPGDVAIDVGANIGALTIPMAKMVVDDVAMGRIYAIEPNPRNMSILDRNVHDNHLQAVVTLAPWAASDSCEWQRMEAFEDLSHKNYGRVAIGRGSLKIPCATIDDLKLDKCKFIKIDVEGHEVEVIRGAKQTIERCRPILMVENDRPERCEQLVAEIVDLGYRAYWFRPPLYNVRNHAKQERNVFGGIISINMVCIPEEKGIEIRNADEVADLRIGEAMYDREIARYERATARNPNDLEARLLMAHYHNLMQRESEAHVLLDENLRIDPEHTASQAVRGLMQLQRGNWREGWPAYELRYKQKTSEQFGNRPHSGERWDGEPTAAPVLIWSEQGFGDSIMFVRFFGEVLARAPNAFLEVQPQLYELFETSEIAPRKLFRLGRTMPYYAKHCSLPSLPYVLGLTSDDDLHHRSPYLRADQAMVDSWLRRSTPRIGVCWSGSPRSERAYSRDIDQTLLDPLMKRFGPFLSLTQDGQFESFADTAAAIAALDLVITVDTAIAHLAGALGVETWLLLSFDPDWRWGLKGDTTLWYPSIRIFRQPRFMDWPAVVSEVAAAFEVRNMAEQGV